MLGYPCTNTADGFGRTYLPALKIFLGMLGARNGRSQQRYAEL
jgi:hypothetical protein